ncbi:hypothetical protein K443DRAFT_101736, partial [Laccaria amethystina LaAM-08-1]
AHLQHILVLLEGPEETRGSCVRVLELLYITGPALPHSDICHTFLLKEGMTNFITNSMHMHFAIVI